MRHGRWVVLAAALALGACASEVRRQPAELAGTMPAAATHLRLSQDVELRLDSGYTRSLARDTGFAVAGRIAQGLVLRPVATVLTVEGKHMHEAYVVVRDARLVGFYLPVERAYSPLSQTVPFPLVEKGNPE